MTSLEWEPPESRILNGTPEMAPCILDCRQSGCLSVAGRRPVSDVDKVNKGLPGQEEARAQAVTDLEIIRGVCVERIDAVA